MENLPKKPCLQGGVIVFEVDQQMKVDQSAVVISLSQRSFICVQSYSAFRVVNRLLILLEVTIW